MVRLVNTVWICKPCDLSFVDCIEALHHDIDFHPKKKPERKSKGKRQSKEPIRSIHSAAILATMIERKR